ncbi:MAG: hypothetical protein R3F51_14270 [Cyanobacteriota/Melainabacteria group bacterium]
MDLPEDPTSAVQPGATDGGVPVEQPKAATAVLNRDGSPDAAAPVKERTARRSGRNPTTPVKADAGRTAADASVRRMGKLVQMQRRDQMQQLDRMSPGVRMQMLDRMLA